MNGIHHTVHHMGRKYLSTKLREEDGRAGADDGRQVDHPTADTVARNGHPLGPNQVLVGHVACLGHGGGGHTSWHCRTFDAVVYGPPLSKHSPRSKGLRR
jgi:hypothetical protein